MTHGEGRDSVRVVSQTDHPPVDDFVGLASDLERGIEGDVRFDEYAQLLYSTDGSIYQARPAGVVEPRHVDDVRTAVRIAVKHNVPILPRGAGSSLGGQTVGPGCLVLDCSTYMDEILSIDPEQRLATVQPGIVQDHLDAELAQYSLKFAPDPASSNRATIGGGIGNNSTGAHSVRYGITDAYTEELKIVLSNGELIHTREVVLDSEEYDAIVGADTREAEIYRTVRSIVEKNTGEIAERYPDLKRSVTGYNLQKVIYENEAGDRVINLSKLMVGSEGTLGVVVEATMSLVTCPKETALAVYCFDDLTAALEAVPIALEYDVSAVELMDAEVFRLASESDGYAIYAEPIPDGTHAALMLEWDDELVPATDGEQRAAFEAAIDRTSERFVDEGDAFAVITAFTEDDQRSLWKLRKAAIPLLMSLEGDPKPYPFIEDATVPPGELAAYVTKFEQILDDHGTTAAYFAHAGSGTLHIRPILNLKEHNGVDALRSITDDVTDLVLEHNGAFSGEHGDGMARTEFTPKMYGPTLWAAFKELKTAFDPEWLLHPGNVVYRSGSEDIGPNSDRGVGADNREHLRYGVDYQTIEPQTTLNFDADGGFSHLVELCNGCGTCRQSGTDVMCPTYRATREELQTTRGRANMLRAAISGELESDITTDDKFQQEVLDLCLGCKGCKTDCPTGVDLAKLKAEVKHQYHGEQGIDLRTRLFADIDRLSALGSKTAPVSNLLPHIPGARMLMERLFGIAPDRDLPTFQRHTFFDWVANHEPGIDPDEAIEKVVFLPDTFTTYIEPEPAIAAVRVLEAAGVAVAVPSDISPTGRAAYSVGRLDLARERAAATVDTLEPWMADGWSVVGIEPSDVEMVRDEYRSLLGSERTAEIATRTMGVAEFLYRTNAVDRLESVETGAKITLHGHCHQHAAGTDHYPATVLGQLGFEPNLLDSGCCGMAGSFGYEAEHYELSMAIAEDLISLIDGSDGEVVAAAGASCRSQIRESDQLDRPVHHPIEVIASAVNR